MCVLGYSKLTLEPPPSPGKPKPVGELREEMDELNLDLPKSVYIVFQKAVSAHFDGELEEAQEYYQRLSSIPSRSSGTYDLACVSAVFRYNLQVLEGQFAAKERS